MAKTKSPVVPDALTDIAAGTGVNLKQRSFSVVGELEDSQVKRFHLVMDLLESISSDPIIINLSSEGGFVDDAWAIVSRITSSPCHVTVNGHGYIESSATLILACADTRTMTRYTKFLHHELYFTPGDDIKITGINYVNKRAQEEWKDWCKTLASWTKKPASFWVVNGIHGNDLILDAKTCLKYGIIDKIK